MVFQREQAASDHSQHQSELEEAKQAESTSRLAGLAHIERLQSELQACQLQYEAATEQHKSSLSEMDETATAMLMEKRQRVEELGIILDAERQRLEEELKKSENVVSEAQAAREAAEAALKVTLFPLSGADWSCRRWHPGTRILKVSWRRPRRQNRPQRTKSAG